MDGSGKQSMQTCEDIITALVPYRTYDLQLYLSWAQLEWRIASPLDPIVEGGAIMHMKSYPTTCFLKRASGQHVYIII